MSTALRNPGAAALAAALALALAGCEEPSLDVPCGRATEIDSANQKVSIAGELRAGQVCSWPLHFTANAVAQVSVISGDVSTTLDGEAETEPGWHHVRLFGEGAHLLRVTPNADGRVLLQVYVFGAPLTKVGAAGIAIMAPTVPLGELMMTLAEDGHGGRMFAKLLQDFGAADPAPRSGPGRLLASLTATYGDPKDWNMNALPFTMTSIENRIDLADGTHCGQLRITFAETSGDDPEFRNFNLSFGFNQPAMQYDKSPSGVAHCANAARQWAQLDGTNPDATLTLLDRLLKRGLFVDLQTSEAIDAAGTWEFRDWVSAPNPDPATRGVLPTVFVNRTLAQAVDVPRLNAAGADRTAFLSFVEQNAAGLANRTVAIPEQFRTRAAQAAAGSWTPLDLTGVSPALLDAYPDLRKDVEITGCAACHHLAAGLVHAKPSSNFSSFLRAEWNKRSQFLLSTQRGEAPRAPYGPLYAVPADWP